MHVSAISASSLNTIFSNRFNNPSVEGCGDKNLHCSKKDLSKLNEAKLFEAINEWKSFCHRQIVDGKLDVIA